MIVTLVVAAMIGGGISLKRKLDHGIGLAYASWGCGDLLVDYLEANSNQWPSDWATLERHYEKSKKTYVGIGSFHYLQQEFEIDFDFNPVADSKAWIDNPEPERVVKYRNGSAAYVSGHEANSRVLQYLVDHRGEIQDGG
ncbi:hypothetical protein [Rhodopirellula sp. SWK7]|uniref:hypothetical protein n=1 Tax=Rhodopirellula sp. SWK7 TaxID=595460 RepID=UPI0011819096|nr:hypothetical protein [Rhodopirellula sp. SWK7]